MKKDIFALIFAVVMIFVVALNVEIQSVDEFYDTQLEEVTSGCETVFLSVSALNELVIVKNEYVLRQNDTVFSVLERVLRFNRVIFDYRGLGDIYIVSIGGVSEFEHGAMSGWLYRVNGGLPSMACNRYFLAHGDVIELIYSIDGGL